MYVDKSFSDNDRTSIDNAIGQWNYCMNNYVRLNVVTYYFDMTPSQIHDALKDKGILVMKIDSTTTFLPKTKESETILAYADEVAGHKLFVIRDRMNVENVEGLILHELGHLLGAMHDNNSYLMQEHYYKDDFQCIDKRSALAVARYQNIPENRVNYCTH